MSSRKGKKIIGLMSGTSLDGLDIVCVTLGEEGGKYFYRIEKAETLEYDEYWKNELANCHEYSGKNLIDLHKKYGRFCGEKVKAFIQKNNLKIDLIGSHGHTVFHEPNNHFNFQLGCGIEIFAQTGIQTISDFRSLDIALGGQGAPLVPIGDKLLFSEFDACINLGGFANISFDDEKGNRIAFDICPVNFIINALAKNLGFEYDKDGAIAAKNTVDEILLKTLNQLDYYQKAAPKSLAREWIEKNILEKINSRKDFENLISTFTHHAAQQISDVLNHQVKKGKVLFTGGGTYNKFLIKLIKSKVKKEIQIEIPDNNLINFKEALVFAFLAYLRINNKENILKEVTGAKSNSISGSIDGWMRIKSS